MEVIKLIDKLNKQVNRGKGNTNISIEEFNITIGNGATITATDFFNSYSVALNDYDEYLKKELGSKIIINKTNREEDFCVSKILKSLLTIGIPLDAAFVIFRESIEKIIGYKTTSGECKLNTKIIRKLVCDSIQTYDMKNYPISQVQSWSQKYVRKYGRNNQLVKVQFENGSTTEMSMNFLKNFVDDLIQSISPNILVKKISNVSRQELAECVLDFVNSCDLYVIRYNVLKSIILEIALQPPHPWFINEETKANIIQYDCSQLKVNLSKAKKVFNSGVRIIPQSILLEIIHHASSMILAKYDYYLGCNDLSSLFLLKSLISELINRPYEDLLYDDFPINTLLSDITKAKINYLEYFNLINSISSDVNTSAVNNASFSDKVNEFGKQTLCILENNSMAEINKFYNTAWSELNLVDVMNNIKLFMNASFGYNESNLNKYEMANAFWYRLSKLESSVLNEIKKNIFVFYGKNRTTNLDAFKKFNNQAIKMGCNTIILISETIDIAEFLKESIKKVLLDLNCHNDYIVIDLDKKCLENIFYSNNPPRAFENILLNKFIIY